MAGRVDGNGVQRLRWARSSRGGHTGGWEAAVCRRSGDDDAKAWDWGAEEKC